MKKLFALLLAAPIIIPVHIPTPKGVGHQSDSDRMKVIASRQEEQKEWGKKQFTAVATVTDDEYPYPCGTVEGDCGKRPQ